MIAKRARPPVVAAEARLTPVELGLAGRSRSAALVQLAGLTPSQRSRASLVAEVERLLGLLGRLRSQHWLAEPRQGWAVQLVGDRLGTPGDDPPPQGNTESSRSEVAVCSAEHCSQGPLCVPLLGARRLPRR